MANIYENAAAAVLNAAQATETASTSEKKFDTSNYIGGDGKPLFVNLVFATKGGELRLPYGMNLVMPRGKDEYVNQFTASLIEAVRVDVPEGKRLTLEGEDIGLLISKLEVVNGYYVYGKGDVSDRADGLVASSLDEDGDLVYMDDVDDPLNEDPEAEAEFCTDVILNPIFVLDAEDGGVIESRCSYGINLSKMGDGSIDSYNEFRDALVKQFSTRLGKGEVLTYSVNPDKSKGERNLLKLLSKVVIQHGKSEQHQQKTLCKKLSSRLNSKKTDF